MELQNIENTLFCTLFRKIKFFISSQTYKRNFFKSDNFLIMDAS